jgi:hypothetical protein
LALRLKLQRIALAVAKQLDPLAARVAALEKANTELREECTNLRAELQQHEFQGPWDHHRSYKRNNSVNSGGHLWICKADTQSKPGTDPDAWKLAVRQPSGGGWQGRK